MPADHIVGDMMKRLVQTGAAFDPWFVADSPDPFIGACGLVTGSSSSMTLEPNREDFLASAKKQSKERNLRGGRGESLDTGKGRFGSRGLAGAGDG